MQRQYVGTPLEKFLIRRCKRTHWERLGRLYEQAGGRGIISEVKFDAAGITLWVPRKEGLLIPWGAYRAVIDREIRFVGE